ncbi:HNH endonuclease family protein [Streptomyces sp. NPDC048606]|uniref:HNH endonuclease family protein n=1 Tax=Streptomyces sp. NPDC048606 TaxID=3154726 RepID=UPI0034431B6C
MNRQSGVRAAVVAAALLLGIAGCGGAGAPGEGKADGGARPTPSVSGSPSASAPTTAPAPSGAAGNPPSAEVLPGMVGVAAARQRLAALKVAAPGTMAGYSRDRFTHWAEQGDRCDTRETVLARDGAGVTRDSECRAVSGRWKSLYDGAEIDDAKRLDIDHMVPLAEAWRSGAAGWDAAKRKAFANDLSGPQLLAVSASSNRSKGDQSPDLWQPTDKSSWCVYGRAWTTVKSLYGLTVTEAERTTLTGMLDTCAAS